jgi:hypothetical protein
MMNNLNSDVKTKHQINNKFIVHPHRSNKPFLSLLIMDRGEMIPVNDCGEVVIGRIMDGQTIYPDIDLSPYKAYSEGVSRIHVSIKISDDGIFITDLGSTNGTRLNGKRIASQKEYPLQNGTHVYLGNFKLMVIIE